MNSEATTLYSLAHELLNLGMDGSPIYSDHLARLNREVYELALKLCSATASAPEEEAELCVSLLSALNATYHDNGRKQQYIQRLLDRSFEVLPQLPASLLKVRLLTYCYAEVYEDALAREAHSIIDTWNKSSLTLEQVDIIEELKDVEENPYPFEVLED